MLYSMTGYGHTDFVIGSVQVSVQVRSLNGKHFDCRLNLPENLQAEEQVIRRLAAQKLLGGSVHISIKIAQNQKETLQLNTQMMAKYLAEIQVFAAQHHLNIDNVFSSLFRLPDVFQPPEDTKLNQRELLEALAQTFEQVIRYREKEGKQTANDILRSVQIIREKKEAIEKDAPHRIVRIRERINQKLQKWLSDSAYDTSRMEEEMIYYIEKLDINEECQRLHANIDYLEEVINEPGLKRKGKKMGFVCQEIGREVNTIGSKVQNAEIQKKVVEMKDELEKIKEQILNVL